AEIQAALGLNRPRLIGWPDASGSSVLGPDYVSIRQRNIGRARKCSGKFLGYDPAATRNAPKQSVTGRTRRKDDRLRRSQRSLFQGLAGGGSRIVENCHGQADEAPGAGHLRRGVRGGGRKTGDGCR